MRAHCSWLELKKTDRPYFLFSSSLSKITELESRHDGKIRLKVQYFVDGRPPQYNPDFVDDRSPQCVKEGDDSKILSGDEEEENDMDNYIII